MATGRKRKERRRLRKREADAAMSPNPSGNGSNGDGTSSMTHAEAQVVSRAITENWAGAQRWPTRAERRQLATSIVERGGPQTANLIEKTTLAAHELIEAEDPKVRGIGMRVAAMMERQNQADDRMREDANKPAAQQVVVVNVNAGESVREVINHDPNYAAYLEQQQLGIVNHEHESTRGTEGDGDDPDGRSSGNGTDGADGQLAATGDAAAVGEDSDSGGVSSPTAHSTVEPVGDGHADGYGWDS